MMWMLLLAFGIAVGIWLLGALIATVYTLHQEPKFWDAVKESPMVFLFWLFWPAFIFDFTFGVSK